MGIVCASQSNKQKLYSALFNKGPTTSMYKCENGTWSRGTILIGTLSLITALAFFWQAKHVSTYPRIVLDISGQKKFKRNFSLVRLYPKWHMSWANRHTLFLRAVGKQICCTFCCRTCHDGTKVHLSQSSYFCFEGSRPRGRPKKTWKEVVREDCQARKLNKEDAMDRCKWRKMIKKHDDPDGCKWVNVSSGTGLPGLSRIKGR